MRKHFFRGNLSSQLDSSTDKKFKKTDWPFPSSKIGKEINIVLVRPLINLEEPLHSSGKPVNLRNLLRRFDKYFLNQSIQINSLRDILAIRKKIKLCGHCLALLALIMNSKP